MRLIGSHDTPCMFYAWQLCILWLMPVYTSVRITRRGATRNDWLFTRARKKRRYYSRTGKIVAAEGSIDAAAREMTGHLGEQREIL